MFIGIVFLLIMLLLELEGWSSIFKKAHEDSWKGIIPIYNLYIAFKVFWKRLYFWLFLGCGLLLYLFSLFAAEGYVFAILIAGIVWLLTYGIITVFFYKLAKKFGHGIGYTIGLLMLRPIFLAIIGFGDSKYQE